MTIYAGMGRFEPMTHDVVQRVARAIKFYCPEGWSEELHRDMARAAIAAIEQTHVILAKEEYERINN